MYFISENNGKWSETNANSIEAAKRAAARAQMFQGSDLYVGERRGDAIVTVAKKLHRDALNMRAAGKWQAA